MSSRGGLGGKGEWGGGEGGGGEGGEGNLDDIVEAAHVEAILEERLGAAPHAAAEIRVMASRGRGHGAEVKGDAGAARVVGHGLVAATVAVEAAALAGGHDERGEVAAARGALDPKGVAPEDGGEGQPEVELRRLVVVVHVAVQPAHDAGRRAAGPQRGHDAERRGSLEEDPAAA